MNSRRRDKEELRSLFIARKPPRQGTADERRWKTSSFIGVDRRFQTLNYPSFNHASRTKLDQSVNFVAG